MKNLNTSCIKWPIGWLLIIAFVVGVVIVAIACVIMLPFVIVYGIIGYIYESICEWVNEQCNKIVDKALPDNLFEIDDEEIFDTYLEQKNNQYVET